VPDPELGPERVWVPGGVPEQVWAPGGAPEQVWAPGGAPEGGQAPELTLPLCSPKCLLHPPQLLLRQQHPRQ